MKQKKAKNWVPIGTRHHAKSRSVLSAAFCVAVEVFYFTVI